MQEFPNFPDEWGQQPQQQQQPQPQLQPPSAASMFGAGGYHEDHGSAHETTPGQETYDSGGRFIRPDYIRITKKGEWGRDQDAAKNTARKVDVVPLVDSMDTPAKILWFTMGDGTSVGEDFPVFRRSTIALTDEQARVMSQIVNDVWPDARIRFGKAVSAYVGARGTTGENFSVAKWDQIVNGLANRIPELERYWSKQHVDWTKGPYGIDLGGPSRLRTFFDSNNRAQFANFFIHVKEVRAVPDTVAVPKLRDGCDGLMFKFTDWQSRSFGVLEKAMKTVMCYAQGVRPDAIPPEQFSKFLQQFGFLASLATVKSKSYGDFIHPRFWCDTKSVDYTYLSLWQAMNQPLFGLLMENREAVLSADRLDSLWLEMAGNIYATGPTSVAKAPTTNADPRRI